jgi:hypothetical protein
MPRGAKPGERRGGRQKGAQNKAKANRELAIRIAGIEPKQFLLNGMGFYQAQIEAELAKGSKADTAKLAAAFAAGKDFAKDAAPYCHARLAAIEHMGKGGGPIEYSDVRDRLARLIAREAAAGVAGSDTTESDGSGS